MFTSSAKSEVFSLLILLEWITLKYLDFFTFTIWKVPVFEVFLVRIFLYLDLIRRDTLYLSTFSLNAGKYGPEKLQIRTLFTQYFLWRFWRTYVKNPVIIPITFDHCWNCHPCFWINDPSVKLTQSAL